MRILPAAGDTSPSVILLLPGVTLEGQILVRRIRWPARLLFAIALILLGLHSAAAQTTCVIDFQELTGPSYSPFTGGEIQSGLATISGGAVATAASYSWWNQSSIYFTMMTDPNPWPNIDVGVDPEFGRVCTDCFETLTISFSQPVSNFSFTLHNGLVSFSPVYRVVINGTITFDQPLCMSDSPCSALTYPFPPEYHDGRVGPTSDIQQVTITPIPWGTPPTKSPYPTGFWDFFIDTIVYNRPDNEPCEPPVPTVQTNPSDDPSLGPPSANIALADGADRTTLYISVEPPVQTTVQLSADFGSVPGSVQTNASGKATATYTAGAIPPLDATTTVAQITATVSENEDTTEVYNFRGEFTEYNFHQTQVPDGRFINRTEWGVSDVQTFFENRSSFLAKFYLVGSKGDRGFFDANGDGDYDPATDSKYCGDPRNPDCSMNGPKKTAAQAFVEAATTQGQKVNPKLLLVQAQKEQSLISSATLPPRDDLNFALGCISPSSFGAQLNCAAERLRRWFDGPGIPPMPYFFPMGATPGASINHFVHDEQKGVSEERRVGFRIFTKATHSLYKYTNYIVAERRNGILGGGNYSFEVLWKQYSDLGVGW